MSFLKGTPNVNSFDQLNTHLTDLEDRIANALKVGEFGILNLEKLSKENERNTEGDVIFVDGVNFDPGGGKGVYYFNGSTFIKLG